MTPEQAIETLKRAAIYVDGDDCAGDNAAQDVIALIRAQAERIKELEAENGILHTGKHADAEAIGALRDDLEGMRAEGKRMRREVEIARNDALREAKHLMPRYFGVWSSTGVHIGVWDDGPTAAKVLGEYPGGKMRDLIDADDIDALIEGDTND
ncbi:MULTISPECIES: hypothetical protein [unclassified Sulfitobacter]|uniref:hypothetical protein n=1 Tax=unclassified Sulfitobacter TaxID=196795 RepID=UPI003745218C